jgi:hypothetical protein
MFLEFETNITDKVFSSIYNLKNETILNSGKLLKRIKVKPNAIKLT